MAVVKLLNINDDAPISVNLTTTYADTYESVSKNLPSWSNVLTYTSGSLTSITYTLGSDTIVKTFGYVSDVLTTIVLSGDTPSGIQLTKTLSYTDGALTGVTYS